ncbi:MAG TPA: bifunctional adenosylcobinamide kinase/adenosylcobinamide-phosphate guanylyltransferase [Chroococcidiopsis sp.]
MPPNPHPKPPLILVTGPSRSGKSEWAEWLAHHSHKPVTYVATAAIAPDDAEWQARIAQHQARRPAAWQTIAGPVTLDTLLQTAESNTCWLIDSLGTWLANLLDDDDETWQQTLQSLVEALQQRQGEVIIVSEETGWGVVPAYPIGRLFRDRLGEATRRIGAIATSVYLVTGGHVLNLSQLGTPLDQAIATPDGR